MADTVGDTRTAEGLDDEARAILIGNDRNGYTVPTAGLYPFQWNWDSAFVALGWAAFDLDRAWREIEVLFQAQWPSGMVPHIVFWSDESTYFPGPDVWRTPSDPASSGISQPPVVATIVRRMIDSAPERAEALLEPLDRWHRWWHSARDAAGLGVMAIAHPWESGRDNLPDWDAGLAAVDVSGVGEYRRRDTDLVDASMRPHKYDYDRYLALVNFGVEHGWDDAVIGVDNPFLVADPAITAILLRAERDLAWMMERFGRDASAVRERIGRMEAGYDRFWNPTAGAYCSFDVRSGVHAAAPTSASFLAPYAGVTERLGEILDLLADWAERVEYLVPSFDPRSELFEPDRYWRGPVWAMVNFMIATGLAEQRGDAAAAEWAERIRRSTTELIGRSGFPESFNPVTGGPVGGVLFSWTAALWLAWARPSPSPNLG